MGSAAAYAAVAISIGSLIVSVSGLLYTHNSKKRELFVKIYDSLLDADRQYGREVLFQACESGSPPDSWDPEDRRRANHALSWLELMGYLHSKGHIPRNDSFAIWGQTAVRTFKAAEQSGFLAYRDGQHGRTIWPYFRQFVQLAEAKSLVEANAPKPKAPTI